MEWRELSIGGAFEITPKQLGDPRGYFMEMYKQDEFAAHLGHPLDLRQVNCSTSAAGVIRGIHFADVPPSQAKYVMCPRGAVLDVVVDIRVGSPTFGQWDTVLLDDVDRRAIYLSEGLGHAFCSLEDGSTVMYLCSAQYAPTREHGVNPLDAAVAIDWPTRDRQGRELHQLFSDKDTAAPGLLEAQQSRLLPTFEAAQAFTASL